MKKDVAHNVEYKSRLTQKLLDKFNNIQGKFSPSYWKKIWMSYNKVFCSRNFQKKIVIIVIHESNKKSTMRDTNFYSTKYYIYQIWTYWKECYDKLLFKLLSITSNLNFITQKIKPSLHDIISLVQRSNFLSP